MQQCCTFFIVYLHTINEKGRNMKLSELKTGEKGIIVKVLGHGGFRKRIVEMGFIKGKSIEVLLNAPLQDPVKYKIMGYEVSLRHSEAELIEVITLAEAKKIEGEARGNELPAENHRGNEGRELGEQPLADSQLEAVAERKHKEINVALVGNPNCGKTSLFNFASGAHERVGNYSGVTVDAKEGHAEFEGYKFNLVDLPGTYSLSAYSPEELYVRKQIIEQTPDIIINVIDASNLERNLYLTTQLIDMHIRMVCALNMFDETEQRGDHIDPEKLSCLLGVPMVPTVFTNGRGVEKLFHTIIQMYESREDESPCYRHIHINHGHEIEHGIQEIQEHLKQSPNVRLRYSTRFLAIKLLEGDKDAEQYIQILPDADEILRHRDDAAKRVKEETGDDCETAIMDAKYGFIHGALEEAGYKTGNKKDTYQTTHLLDRILTNKWVGFPIFILLLAVMFATTFMVGQYPMDWIETLVEMLGSLVGDYMPEGPIKAMLVDGVIGGVGAVIVFLPQILILYFFISFMEDSGYMSRAAFIMDKLMHRMGLHGKSFIPLIMGLGCNVPAVMATRTIESRRSRLVTMLILPLMSCEARIPIYIMIIGTFFAGGITQTLVMLSLYLMGMTMAVLMSKLFTSTLFKGEDTPFVMELPPYRFPTWKAIFRHTWEKGRQYLKKMGGIILVASVIVWALGYFPYDENVAKTLSDTEVAMARYGEDSEQAHAARKTYMEALHRQQEQSYIGQTGHLIEPLFTPQGFNWKLDVGILAGVAAKEIVASTMGVLYSNDNSFSDDNGYNNEGGKYNLLRHKIQTDIANTHGLSYEAAGPIAILTAYCFLLFVLLYFPCIATIAAIKGETGSWKWALFTAAYTTCLAWIVSAMVFQIGSLFL